jgi:hypothetical protein
VIVVSAMKLSKLPSAAYPSLGARTPTLACPCEDAACTSGFRSSPECPTRAPIWRTGFPEIPILRCEKWKLRSSRRQFQRDHTPRTRERTFETKSVPILGRICRIQRTVPHYPLSCIYEPPPRPFSCLQTPRNSAPARSGETRTSFRQRCSSPPLSRCDRCRSQRCHRFASDSSAQARPTRNGSAEWCCLVTRARSLRETLSAHSRS